MKKAVILVSGGIDSATVLATMQGNYEVYAISFDYMQRHNIELEKAKKLARDYNVKQHKVISIDLRAFGGSALTDDIDVPKYSDASQLADNIPITYVPARNTIFLSYALGFAEVIGAHDIFVGVHATDYSNYPDCRSEYIKSFETMANLAIALAIQGQRITIHTPIINMTKTEIVKEGLRLGVDYSKTISCYDPTPEGLSCGTCLACLVRLKAFTENGQVDQIPYVKMR
jgi:7-cyano-7-deazaguanine synthase